MKIYSIILVFLVSLILGMPASAEDQGKHEGPEVSAEHKSEQGLEHGKAYAGTREKNEKEEKEEKESKEKGDKDKKDKNSKTDNEDYDVKEKKEKEKERGKKGKKEK